MQKMWLKKVKVEEKKEKSFSFKVKKTPCLDGESPLSLIRAFLLGIERLLKSFS